MVSLDFGKQEMSALAQEGGKTFGAIAGDAPTNLRGLESQVAGLANQGTPGLANNMLGGLASQGATNLSNGIGSSLSAGLEGVSGPAMKAVGGFAAVGILFVGAKAIVEQAMDSGKIRKP